MTVFSFQEKNQGQNMVEERLHAYFGVWQAAFEQVPAKDCLGGCRQMN